MKKRALLMAAAFLTMLAAVEATKSFTTMTSTTRFHAPARAAVSVFPLDMMAIVPAPVIDTHAEVFIGTGDGSGGTWVKQ
jgi:hypothetical protein